MTVPFKAENNQELASYFLKILHLFHNLTGQELQLTELLLSDYLDYNAKLKDRKKSFEMIFSTKAKARYREELNVKPQRLVNLFYSLRKKKVLIGEAIAGPLIPNAVAGTVNINFKLSKNY